MTGATVANNPKASELASVAAWPPLRPAAARMIWGEHRAENVKTCAEWQADARRSGWAQRNPVAIAAAYSRVQLENHGRAFAAYILNADDTVTRVLSLGGRRVSRSTVSIHAEAGA